MRVVSVSGAIEQLIRGGVGVIPTDTIYCIAARASIEDAVARVYTLKRRARKPGPIIAASVHQLIGLGVEHALLADREGYWVAGRRATSVETPMPPRLAYLHQGTCRQALRVVTDHDTREMLEETGPLLITSANLPENEPASNVESAWRYFQNAVDFYVDGGDLSGRVPSEIIRLKGGRPEVVRPG